MKGNFDVTRGVLKNLKREKFETIRSRHVFDSIAGKLTTQEMAFAFTEMQINSYTLNTQGALEACSVFKERTLHNQYILEDLSNIMKYVESHGTTLKSLSVGDNPAVLRMYTKGFVTLETMVVINCMTNFTACYTGLDPLLEDTIRLIKRYSLLFAFNRDAVKINLK